MKYLKYFPSLEKYTAFLESEEYKMYLPKVVFCEENDELSYVREASTPRYAWFQPSVGDVLLTSVQGVNSIKINGETVEFEPYHEEYKSATYQEHIAMTEWDGDPYYTTTDKNGNTIYKMNTPTKLAVESCPMVSTEDYIEIGDDFNPEDYTIAIIFNINGQIDITQSPLTNYLVENPLLTIKDNKIQMNGSFSYALGEIMLVKLVGASLFTYLFNHNDPSSTNYTIYGTTHYNTQIHVEEKHLIPCVEDELETNVCRMELDIEPEKISPYIFVDLLKQKSHLICLEDGFYEEFSSTLMTFGGGLCNRVEIIDNKLIKTYHKELTLPDSIKAISAGGFSGNTHIEKVILGKNMVAIGASAFKDCTSLKSVEFTENLELISNEAFENCTSLADISNLSNVNYIGTDVFNGCNLITTVVDNLIYIGESYLVGYEDSSLLPQNFIIPNTVSHIGVFAFQDCFNLKTLVIPDNVKTIGDGAFYGCKTLEEVSMGNGLCPKELSFIDSATASLGEALMGLLASSYDIGDRVFYGCNSLTKIVCTASKAPIIYDNTFSNIAKYGTLIVPYGCGYESWEGYFLDYNWTINYLGAPTIDLNVIHELKKTDETTFRVLSNAENVEYMYINGVDYGIVDTYTYTWKADDGDTVEIKVEIKLKDTTRLSPEMFKDCTNLAYIIYKDQFDELTGDYIGNAYETITTVGESCFENCTSLYEFDCPMNVHTIENKVFYNCTSMYHSGMGGMISTIGDRAFYNCISLENTSEIFNVVEHIGNEAFVNACLPDVVSMPPITIGDRAFENAEFGSNYIQLPMINTIGEEAFKGCKNIENIVLDGNIEYIGKDAFANIEYLSSIAIFTYTQTQFNESLVSPKEEDGYVYFLVLRGFDTSALESVINENDIIGDAENEGLSDIITVTYNIVDVTQPVKLCNNVDNLHPDMLNAMDPSWIVDGALIVPNADILGIEEAGLHPVELQLNKSHLINEECFKDCTNIVNIQYNGYRAFFVIEDNAFEGCTNLTNIITDIDEGWSNVYIGNESFKNCTSLEYISDIYMYTIGDRAFMGCSSLIMTNIYCTLYMGSEVFKNTSLANIDASFRLYYSQPTIETDTFNGVPENGVIYVNAHDVSFENWLEYLPEGWTIEYQNN